MLTAKDDINDTFIFKNLSIKDEFYLLCSDRINNDKHQQREQGPRSAQKSHKPTAKPYFLSI